MFMQIINKGAAFHPGRGDAYSWRFFSRNKGAIKREDIWMQHMSPKHQLTGMCLYNNTSPVVYSAYDEVLRTHPQCSLLSAGLIHANGLDTYSLSLEHTFINYAETPFIDCTREVALHVCELETLRENLRRLDNFAEEVQGPLSLALMENIAVIKYLNW
jgi:hypothetical protein